MQAIAFERSTLYGIVVNPKKRVNYGPMNPVEARELFYPRRAGSAARSPRNMPNAGRSTRTTHQLMLDIETLEHKSRRPDVLVDDELIVAFYDRVIPEDITNGVDFDKWRKEAERETPKLLYLKREDLMRHEAAGVTTEDISARNPARWHRFRFELSVRAGIAEGRRHDHRAARPAQPDSRRSLRVAGAGDCSRKRSCNSSRRCRRRSVRSSCPCLISPPEFVAAGGALRQGADSGADPTTSCNRAASMRAVGRSRRMLSGPTRFRRIFRSTSGLSMSTGASSA